MTLPVSKDELERICPSDEGGYTWYCHPPKGIYYKLNNGTDKVKSQILDRSIPDPVRTKASGGVVSGEGRLLWADSLKRRAR